MKRDPIDWIPEAIRYVQAYDRSRTFEQFWDDYLTAYGVQNPALAHPESTPEGAEAFRGLQDVLEPFMASLQGRQDSDVIDPSQG